VAVAANVAVAADVKGGRQLKLIQIESDFLALANVYARFYALQRFQTSSMAHIQIHEGESIENALRRFKRKVLQEDIIKDAKKHSFYLKPGEKKRIKQALARKRTRKKIRRQPPEER